MKILFICNTPDSRETGMAKIMNCFAEELRKKGHEVDLIFRAQVPVFGPRRLREIFFPFLMFIPVFKLWKRKGRHDLVAIHSLEGAVYVLLRRLFKALPPCVIVSYGSDEMRWELEKEEDRLNLRRLSAFSKVFYPAVWITQARIATKFADHVMLTAKCEIDFNKKYYGVPRERMTFIPNGAGPEYFITRDYGHPARKLLYFGGWEWRKGIRYLAESFFRISLEFPDVTLTLAGVGVEPEEALSFFDESVRSKISVLPKVTSEETPLIYAEHDLFIFPSLFESMSLVLPEAMASGLPVVTTRACGMQDIVEDGVSGFLTKPRDTDGLTEKMRILLKSAPTREKLGRAAQQKARELEWSRVTQELEAMYFKVLEGKRDIRK